LEPAPDRLLREAVEADPANPFPCFELASRWPSGQLHF
jgi:hypothetical protein